MRRLYSKLLAQDAVEVLRGASLSNAVRVLARHAWRACCRLAKTLRNRRETRRLLEFDDHSLADLGLRRADVSIALRLPIHLDPSLALAERRNESDRIRSEKLWERRRRVRDRFTEQRSRLRITQYTANGRSRPKRILIVPGLGGLKPGHWQHEWLRIFWHCRLVEQQGKPDPQNWVASLARAVEESPGALIVADGIGCATVAHLVRERPYAPVAGALLVCPADVDRWHYHCAVVGAFAPMPLSTFPFPAVAVASADDPFVSIERARVFADAWGARFVHAGHGGRLDESSGVGSWSPGMAILADLIDQVDPAVESSALPFTSGR